MKEKQIQKLLVILLGAAVSFGLVACSSQSSDMKAIQTVKAKDLTITLLSSLGELKQGENNFVLEFRSAANNQPVDVGRVAIASTMSMPGMAPMSAGVELEPAGQIGRYQAKAGFAMSAAWRFSVQWDGPAGKGSTTFNTDVR